MVKKLLLLFIFLSFITQTFAETGFWSRLTLCDVFGFLAIGIFCVTRKEFNTSKLAHSAFFLCVLLLIGGIFGGDLSKTLAELLILVFLIATFQITVNTFSTPKHWKVLVNSIVYTLIACVIVGFLDLYGKHVGLPTIFPARTIGEMKSGFRNAGQAGAYSLMFLTILLPIRLSAAKHLFTRSESNRLTIAILAGIIFLFLTAKIAGYIGFAAGYLFYVFLKRKILPVIVIGLLGALLFISLPFLQIISPTVYSRMEVKIQSRIVERYKWLNSDQNSIDEGGEDFFRNNWSSAISAFVEKPITGTGIGAFAGDQYGRHEVHSTYLKMLGEGGLLGVVGYLVLLVSVFGLFRFPFKSNPKIINPYRDYLLNVYPFFLGCMISWTYTYHIRKREFWIMLAVFLIAHSLALRFENERRHPASKAFFNFPGKTPRRLAAIEES